MVGQQGQAGGKPQEAGGSCSNALDSIPCQMPYLAFK